MSTTIILDCDPGIDDALAIAFAAGSPEIELAGLTTVAGNVELAKTTANALAVASFVGLGSVPVTAGCGTPLLRPALHAGHVHGESGLGGAVLPTPSRSAEGGHAIDYIIESAAAAIDLDPALLPKRVGSYSKGSGQKLGIAAVLLSERDLLVLDEPTSGLDPRARAFLKAEIKVTHERGATVLFSSHSLADIEELCDCFALLHAGQIRHIGSAAELCERTGAATLDAAFLKAIE